MAPAKKGSKREAQGAAGAAVKKAKQATEDPALEGVAQGIEQAADLPESCRRMLLACIPQGLGVPADERHEAQHLAVQMIGEVLGGIASKLKQAVDEENAQVASFEARRAELAQAAAAAGEVQAEKAAAVEASTAKFADADAAEKAAKAALQERQEDQRTGDAGVAKSRESKQALEQGMETHLRAIRDGTDDGAGHHKALSPLLQDLGFDPSLLSALPSTCVRKPAERGNFDAMVLDQLEAGLKDKVAALAQAVEEATPAAEERAAAVAKAQEGLDSASAAQRAAAEHLASAQSEEKQAMEAVAAAKAAVAAYEPEYTQATQVRDQKAGEMEKFTWITMKNFETLRDRTSPKTLSGA